MMEKFRLLTLGLTGVDGTSEFVFDVLRLGPFLNLTGDFGVYEMSRVMILVVTRSIGSFVLRNPFSRGTCLQTSIIFRIFSRMAGYSDFIPDEFYSCRFVTYGTGGFLSLLASIEIDQIILYLF